MSGDHNGEGGGVPQEGPGAASEASGDGSLPAQAIIQRFGGIRPMAQKLGVPVSTVQGWKERAIIPANRREEVIAAAARHAIALEQDLLASRAGDPVGPEGDVPLGSDVPITLPSSLPSEGGGEQSEASAAEPRPFGIAPAAAPSGAAPAGAAPAGAALSGAALSGAAPAGAGRGAAIAAAIIAAAVVAAAISGSAPWWTHALGLVPRAPAETGGLAARVEDLTQRLAALEARPAQPVEGGAAVSDLAGRVADLEGKNDQIRAELDRQANAPASPGGAAAAEALAKRLDAAEAKLQSLQGDLATASRAAAAVAPERIVALADRIEEVSAELQAMQSKLSGLVDLPQRVDALGRRIETASGQGLRTAFVLAAGQLEAALDSGQPFASELNAVRRLAGSDADLTPALDELEQSAGSGVPTQAHLRARFGDTALAVAQAANSEVAGSWIDRALGRLRSVVTIRPVGGDVAGDTPEARLARAEARLDEGDLAAAVGELEDLTGNAAEAAAPWLADARARVAADAAILRLRERALARVVPDSQ